jgi:hypothetical protein
MKLTTNFTFKNQHVYFYSSPHYERTVEVDRLTNKITRINITRK